MSYRKWRPSKSQAREFYKEMEEIKEFCWENNIDYSLNMDSYYFTIEGKQYRVSNHTIESSNAGAYRDGVQIREKYHADTREENVTYIHAGKTRIREIYNDLKAGYTLDGKGNRKVV